MRLLPILLSSLLLPVNTPTLLSSAVITATLLVSQAPTHAQNAESVAKVAEAITVRIEGATQGSGVLVRREGNRYTVLTAWHVVSGQRHREELAITTADGKSHQVEQGSIKRIGNVDLATLTFISSETYRLADTQTSQAVSRGNPLIVAGFPVARSGRMAINRGIAIANTELGIDNGYQLIYNSATADGMSGGPVLNTRGQLVAIHGRGEKDQLASFLKSGTVKTGANQGVPIDHYLMGPRQVPITNIESQPKTSEDYIVQAKAILGKEDLEQAVRLHTAERLLSRAIEIEPSSDAYRLRGSIRYELKEHKGAVADIESAYRIDPKSFRSLMLAAWIYEQIGKRAEAIQLVSHAIARNPSLLISDADADYDDVIRLFLNGGETSKALDLLNAVVRLNPTNSAALISRSLVRKRVGDSKGAVADFKEASKYESYNMNRSEIVEIIKQTEGLRSVLEYYDTMIARFPRDRFLYSERSTYREEANDLKGYYEDELWLFNTSDKESLDYISLSDAKLRIGDRDGARHMLQQALRKISQEQEGDMALSLISNYGSIADRQKDLGDIEGARTTLDIAIQRFPKDPHAYSSRAVFRDTTLNDREGALEDYKTAARLSGYDSSDMSSWAWIIERAYYDSQDERHLHAAIEIYDLGVAHHPKEGSNYTSRAKLKAQLGDLNGALDDLNKAVLLENRHFKERAEILVSLGRVVEAKADIDRAILQLDMTDVYDIADLAEFIHEQFGHTEKALALLDNGIKSNLGSQYAETLFAARAVIREASGDAAGACTDHRTAISIGKDNVESSVEWLQSSKGAFCRQ